MNDRFRRLLITFGPVLGALLLLYIVNMAVDTYSVGVEDLRTERRATATAEAQQAISDTAELTDSVAETTTNPIDITEAITAVLPPTVTEEINLDAALDEGETVTDTATLTETATITDTETITETEPVSATETTTDTEGEEITAGEEVTATEAVTE